MDWNIRREQIKQTWNDSSEKETFGDFLDKVIAQEKQIYLQAYQDGYIDRQNQKRCKHKNKIKEIKNEMG